MKKEGEAELEKERERHIERLAGESATEKERKAERERCGLKAESRVGHAHMQNHG